MKVNSKIHPSSESVSDSEKLWSNHPFPPSKNISLERFTARSGKEPQVPLRLVPSLQSLSRQATAKKLILFLQKLINLTKYQQKLVPKKTHQLNIGYFCLCPVKLEDLFHFLPASQPFSAHVLVFSFTFRLGRFEMSQESLDSCRTKGTGRDSNESVRKNVMTWIFPSRCSFNPGTPEFFWGIKISFLPFVSCVFQIKRFFSQSLESEMLRIPENTWEKLVSKHGHLENLFSNDWQPHRVSNDCWSKSI